MRPKEHREFAKVIARAVYDSEVTRRGIQRDLLTEFIASQVIDWIGNNIGTLPDWLEPGTNIHHRSICHSKDAYRLCESTIEDIRLHPSKNWWWDVGRLMALAAYQSHLTLDSTTPMGIPDYQQVLHALGIIKPNQNNNNPYQVQNNW